MDILQLVEFCILMEQGGGIEDKSPSYIMEKWKLCGFSKGKKLSLDMTNQAKFDRYVEKWGVDNPGNATE